MTATDKMIHRESIRARIDKFRIEREEIRREVLDELAENGFGYLTIDEVAEVIK